MLSSRGFPILRLCVTIEHKGVVLLEIKLEMTAIVKR